MMGPDDEEDARFVWYEESDSVYDRQKKRFYNAKELVMVLLNCNKRMAEQWLQNESY